jgi:hypothetical protein
MIKNYDELVKHLVEKNDISMIQKYEIEILEENEQAIETLYKNYIFSYLDVHFGEKSVSLVKNLLMHLKSIGAKRSVSNIENGLFETYKDRKSFLKNL